MREPNHCGKMLDKICYHLKSHWLVDRMSGHSTLLLARQRWSTGVLKLRSRILWIIALQGSIWTKNWTQIFESFKNVYTFTIFRVPFQRNLGNLRKELKEELKKEFFPGKWNDFLWNFPAERILKVFKSRVLLKFSIWRDSDFKFEWICCDPRQIDPCDWRPIMEEK